MVTSLKGLRSLLVLTLIVSNSVSCPVVHAESTEPPIGPLHLLNSYDLEALQMLKNVVAGEETYFVKQNSYVSCKSEDCLSVLELESIVKHYPKGITLTIVVDSSEDRYVGFSRHSLGSGKVFYWDSEGGGLVNAPPKVNGKILAPEVSESTGT